MKKQTKMVNRVNKKQLYNSIMESVIPEIKKALKESEEDADKKEEDNVDEAALNELFGFGSSVKKPEKALSLENTDDENDFDDGRFEYEVSIIKARIYLAELLEKEGYEINDDTFEISRISTSESSGS